MTTTCLASKLTGSLLLNDTPEALRFRVERLPETHGAARDLAGRPE